MSWALWITGVPGSGKSTLARETARRLRAEGEPVVVLESDEVRKVLTPTPVYTDAEREVVYRALVYLARTLAEAGVPVILDATAHRRAWRDLARACIARFAEVQLECPAEEARRREADRAPGHAPRGIYAKAGRPGARVPGVDVPYERALAPELTIDTAAEEVEAAVEAIVALARSLRQPRAAPPPAATWAIWITGPPGSGKTTLAWAVAEALAARDVPARVIDAEDVRWALLGGGAGPEPGEDILHRAIVYAAKLLAEAGIPVIVDATARRRSWRQMARELIGRFAEVQLVCPRELCVERERAVRWRLAPCGRRAHRAPAPAPDIVFDYEESLRPELVLHTDVQHAATAAQAILDLAWRLHATAAGTPRSLERRVS